MWAKKTEIAWFVLCFLCFTQPMINKLCKSEDLQLPLCASLAALVITERPRGHFAWNNLIRELLFIPLLSLHERLLTQTTLQTPIYLQQSTRLTGKNMKPEAVSFSFGRICSRTACRSFSLMACCDKWSNYGLKQRYHSSVLHCFLRVHK